MPFYKIKDPVLRDAAVQDYLALKKRLHIKDETERIGKAGFEKDIGELFKPITEESKQVKEEIKALPFEQLRQEIAGLPPAIAQAMPLPPPPKQLVDAETATSLGRVKPSTSKADEGERKQVEKKEKPIDYYAIEIGGLDTGYPTLNKNPIAIDENRQQITFMGKTYNNDNNHLFNLIFAKNPSKEALNNENALISYAKILIDSNILHQNGDYTQNKPDETMKNQPKWNLIQKEIWFNRFYFMDDDYIKANFDIIRPQMEKFNKALAQNKKQADIQEETIDKVKGYIGKGKQPSSYRGEIQRRLQSPTKQPTSSPFSGKGITGGKNNPIIIPEGIKELGDRIRKLWASKLAGNTGLRNEIVAICDALRSKNAIEEQHYATIMNEL